MTESTFDLFALRPELRRAVADLGFQTPTPIQAQGIPALLAGRDVIAQSRTGSGKTLAFALPALEKISLPQRRLQVLALSPTRELAEQVAREFRKLGRYLKELQVLTLCGGHPVYHQLRSLEHGAHVAVGTPGRIQDHIDRKSLDLSGIAVVILDEADRMLDMGFKEKIEKILSLTPAERQTALFSATFPVTITALSRRFQRDPERITVETPADQAAAIDQFAFRVSETEKAASLAAFLRSRPLESVLVFCNQKFRVDELADFLREEGYSVGRLHGDLEQAERERVMAKFRNLSTRILVATDVAARGIDVIGLDAVVNFDLPADPQVYVHRIGRTGRAGKTGLALSFLTSIESEKANRIVAMTGTPLRIETPPSGKSVPAGRVSATMDTLSISAGRKEKLRPGDLLGALTGDAGVPGDQVGKIEILDHVSFVAVDRQSSALAYDRLRNGKIKGRRFLVQWVK